jgi:hypothetical protein
LAQFFTDLMRKIETDRRTLEQIAACADTQASPRKQAGFGSVAKHLVPEAADRTIHLILAKYMADDDDRKPRRRRGASLRDRRAPASQLSVKRS